MSNSTEQSERGKLTRYWRRVVILTMVLASFWLLVTLLPLVLVGTPQSWTLFGWPFAYAVVAFAAPLAYLLLIGVYAVVMGHHDKAFRKEDGVDPRGTEF